MKPALVLVLACVACATRPSTHVSPLPAPHPASVLLLLDGSPIEFQDPRVLSIDDDDREFEVTLTPRVILDTDEPHTLVLARGTHRYPSQAFGRAGATSYVTLRVTADSARELADALGVPAVVRAAWKIELTGRLEPGDGFDEDSGRRPMRFILRNDGREALWFLDGGRGRNELGRDNRFRFDVECGDRPLEMREVLDFGGLGTYRRLEPGQEHAFTVELAQWCRLEGPATCRVHAGYEADLMPAEFEPGRTYPFGVYSHMLRRRTVPAQLVVQVR